MNLSAIFIRRPVMTVLVMFAILVFGLMSYRYLPVSNLPMVDFPTIQVTANLPGADPETMASSVATPLEKEFSSISGLDSMTSSNFKGTSRITLQFALHRNIDAAAQDVQSAISLAARKLPREMPAPPFIRKVNPADQPVLYLVLKSPTQPLYKVNEYAENMLAQRISMVSGVALVNVYGSQKYAVRVRLDPQAMASREIGIDEVATAIANGNVNLPVGSVAGPQKEFTVKSSGKLEDAQAYRPLIVAYRGGAPVRLGDIGQVLDSVEKDKVAAWFKEERAIILAVQRQPGANTVETVKAVRDLLPAFNEQLPASIQLQVLYDRSETIKESIDDVRFTLGLTIILVILVIFVFLRNIRATLIPSLAVPLSLIGTFGIMYLFNFSIDNLSLMALTLCVGFVVDDAIVMLENIVRHTEQGESVHDAAMNGSKEISFTILSMTVSLAAVFIPVLFMGGVVGRLFNEFAVTISAAILISGFISLSLTPMLCRFFLKPHTTETHGKFYNAFENIFNLALRFYERTLAMVMRHRFTVLLISFALVGLMFFLFSKTTKGFLPSEDTGQVMVFTEAEQGISFEAMTLKQKALADVVLKDENVYAFMSVCGAGGPNTGGNQGRMFIVLKPRHERKLSADQFIASLRPRFAQVQGIRAFLMNPPSISIGGQSTKSQYQFTLQSPDTVDLFRYGTAFEAKVREIPGLVDVTSDMQIKNPQLSIALDRDKASAMGVSARQFEDALYSAYSSREVSTIYAASNDYQVIMELDPKYQRNPFALSMLYIRSKDGKLVPLSSLAKMELSVGPMSINHTGQLSSVTISFNLTPGASLGDAVKQVEKLARDTLPASFSTGFQGTAQAFQASMKNLVLLVVMSIVVIYIVLGILYESFIHPVTILSGLPSAGLGAIITLIVFQVDLDLYGFVGMIMLIGIVKKNAIMMIDFAVEASRKNGKTPEEAIVEGCLTRFRPIMMTTMAALMGTLPIALGYGAGAEARRPLGLAVVGGLLVSQILTLYLTPVYYVYLDKAGTWIQSLFRRKRNTPRTV